MRNHVGEKPQMQLDYNQDNESIEKTMADAYIIKIRVLWVNRYYTKHHLGAK